MPLFISTSPQEQLFSLHFTYQDTLLLPPIPIVPLLCCDGATLALQVLCPFTPSSLLCCAMTMSSSPSQNRTSLLPPLCYAVPPSYSLRFIILVFNFFFSFLLFIIFGTIVDYVGVVYCWFMRLFLFVFFLFSFVFQFSCGPPWRVGLIFFFRICMLIFECSSTKTVLSCRISSPFLQEKIFAKTSSLHLRLRSKNIYWRLFYNGQPSLFFFLKQNPWK